MSMNILTSFESISNLAVDRLFASPSVEITAYRCVVAHRRESSEQAQPGHVISFPHTGAFEIRDREGWTVIDPNLVLFHNAWAPYTTRHPLGGHDSGATLAVREDILLEVVGRHDPAVAEHPASPFASTHRPLSSRAALLERMLFRGLTGPEHFDALLVEEVALHLVETVTAPQHERRSGSTATADAGHRQRAELVEAAKALLAGSFRAQLSLSQLAAELATSPFHLARSFKEHTGLTVHRYLTRLRLRDALERLREAPSGLARLAVDLGFDSHSHFTAAFRREYGVTPAAIRKAGIPGQILRRMADGAAERD
jgi:AraC family transcriptional regulator